MTETKRTGGVFVPVTFSFLSKRETTEKRKEKKNYEMNVDKRTRETETQKSKKKKRTAKKPLVHVCLPAANSSFCVCECALVSCLTFFSL
jgi:hypothetical protein